MYFCMECGHFREVVSFFVKYISISDHRIFLEFGPVIRPEMKGRRS